MAKTNISATQHSDLALLQSALTPLRLTSSTHRRHRRRVRRNDVINRSSEWKRDQPQVPSLNSRIRRARSRVLRLARENQRLVAILKHFESVLAQCGDTAKVGIKARLL